MKKPRQKILIIDDELRVVQMLTFTLEQAGFQVVAAMDGKEGLRLAYLHHPDLVLLDMAMPDMDGFEVLDHLRVVTDIPIIMLTAYGYDANRIRSLDKGAADLISKGTSYDVLLAHIHARLRAHPARQIPEGPRRFDENLEVDFLSRRVRFADELVSLTPLQWKLLQALIENEGRVTTHHSLLDAGWDGIDNADPHAVKVQISHLREKLHDSARHSRYIHTIREEGYLFGLREE